MTTPRSTKILKPKREPIKKERKGYYIDKRTGYYKVKIMIEGKNTYICTCHTEEEARAAYKEARAKHPKLPTGKKSTPSFKKTRNKDYDFTGTPWYGL
jgi:hypothetical protein